MEPIKLPLLPTGEDNTLIVLLPGLDRSNLKKCEYNLDEDTNLLTVTCLYGGLNEEGEIDGVTYPIEIDEETTPKVRKMEKLYPMNPLDVDLEEYFDPEEADQIRLFLKKLENRYGRSIEEDH